MGDQGTGMALQGGLPLLAVRILFLAGLLGSAGSLLCRWLVTPAALAAVPPAAANRLARLLHRLLQVELLAALAGLAALSVGQSALMAGASGLAALEAVPRVLELTRFGHVCLLQGALLILAWRGARLGSRPARGACLAALAAVAAEAWHGHAAASSRTSAGLALLDVLHLLAAAGWIGGLPPLLLIVWRASPRAGLRAARAFSRPGRWFVVVLSGAGLLQARVLVGRLAQLTGSVYGRVVLAKLALFATLLALALLNRYRFAPALREASAPAARRRLGRSILVQSAAGLLAVAAAATLSGLIPPADRGGLAGMR